MFKTFNHKNPSGGYIFFSIKRSFHPLILPPCLPHQTLSLHTFESDHELNLLSADNSMNQHHWSRSESLTSVPLGLLLPMTLNGNRFPPCRFD